MNLDSYKEQWKNSSQNNSNPIEKDKMLSIIHERMKSNVRKNTVGLLGITMGCSAMILPLSNYQKSISDPLVNKVILFLIPTMLLLALVSGTLYYLTNVKNANEKNTQEYLTQLISRLKLLNKLFYYIVLPLIPIMTMPLVLMIIDQGHVAHEAIYHIFLVAGIILACWWLLGFTVLFKKILSAHDYYKLQLKVEEEFAQL